MIGYYAAIAPTLLPHLAERPVTRMRWPDRVGTDTAHGVRDDLRAQRLRIEGAYIHGDLDATQYRINEATGGN